MQIHIFKVIIGKHFDGPTEYKSGDTLESVVDLRELFPNKFELIETRKITQDSIAARKAADVPADDDSSNVGDSGAVDDTSPDHPKFGRDVSNEFSNVVDAGLLAYTIDGKKFSIVDPDMPKSKELINAKPVSRAKVSQVVSEYIEG